MQPKILVVRGGAIGDFILTLPALRLLREGFPSAHIEILGYDHIVTLACHGRYYADGCRSIEYGPLSAFFVPNGELDAALVEYFGSFQQVVSYLFDPDLIFERNVRRCGVKHYLHASPKVGPHAHATEQLAAPLQSLALYLEDPHPVFHPSNSDTEFAASALAGRSQPLVALHPGSGGEPKIWPTDRWLALCEQFLARHPALHILLVGGEADHSKLDFLKDRLPSARTAVLRDARLPELGAVLGKCDLFLGHDSGISHLAAATGIPCVLLFGPTDPDVWAPRNPAVQTVVAMDGRMEDVQIEEVSDAVQRAVPNLFTHGL